MEEKLDWEKEFDKKHPWTEIEHNDGCCSAYYMGSKGEIKSFIRSEREKAYKEGLSNQDWSIADEHNRARTDLIAELVGEMERELKPYGHGFDDDLRNEGFKVALDRAIEIIESKR